MITPLVDPLEDPPSIGNLDTLIHGGLLPGDPATVRQLSQTQVAYVNGICYLVDTPVDDVLHPATIIVQPNETPTSSSAEPSTTAKTYTILRPVAPVPREPQFFSYVPPVFEPPPMLNRFDFEDSSTLTQNSSQINEGEEEMEPVPIIEKEMEEPEEDVDVVGLDEGESIKPTTSAKKATNVASDQEISEDEERRKEGEVGEEEEGMPHYRLRPRRTDDKLRKRLKDYGLLQKHRRSPQRKKKGKGEGEEGEMKKDERIPTSYYLAYENAVFGTSHFIRCLEPVKPGGRPLKRFRGPRSFQNNKRQEHEKMVRVMQAELDRMELPTLCREILSIETHENEMVTLRGTLMKRDDLLELSEIVAELVCHEDQILLEKELACQRRVSHKAKKF